MQKHPYPRHAFSHRSPLMHQPSHTHARTHTYHEDPWESSTASLSALPFLRMGDDRGEDTRRHSAWQKTSKVREGKGQVSRLWGLERCLAKRDRVHCPHQGSALQPSRPEWQRRKGWKPKPALQHPDPRGNSSPIVDTSPTSQRRQDTFRYVNHLFEKRILSRTSEQAAFRRNRVKMAGTCRHFKEKKPHGQTNMEEMQKECQRINSPNGCEHR